MADGAFNNAKGTQGGHNGAKIQNYLRTEDGKLNELPACSDIILQPGQNIVSYSSGGGGYGPPHERPVEKVRNDMEEGWITRERARDVYGVAFKEDGNIDEKETARLRKALAGTKE